ncbi:N-6 DNA methylase [Kineococcus sp. LSe6-4]|uniref:site-specific DNA-methyltransferase (adenine-specific) n=1 Tax=Kineococcus halophytocola TaxID=3234027 RepID=A0ABV4H450_9ACTN
MTQVEGFGDKVGFIWSIADLLRGDYRPHEYGQVILPLTVLRRLDCALAPTKTKVLERDAALTVQNKDRILKGAAKQPFYNTSPLDFTRLLDDHENLAANLLQYASAFSAGTAEVLEKYNFANHVERLDAAGLLYQVVSRFHDVDLGPEAVPNEAMGYIFEELLRRFNEMSNETAGEHFTPREVIKLMVNILFSEDDEALRGSAPVRSMFDPACGTGGMLIGGQEHLHDLNERATLEIFGQELNGETWAMARSDLMIKQQEPESIQLGNSLSADAFPGRTFDYLLANPPFGVDWKRIQKTITDEQANLGMAGRFGVGLPRVSDGSLLFLQHMISKMKPVEEGGSRLAIVFSGSPLFSGGAGSGESEIRKWIIENDWLEAVVGLPDQLFYNTGISTYFWVLTNRKAPERRGKVLLLDARESWTKMRKSLGDKRKYVSDEQIADVTRLYHDALAGDLSDERVRVFANEDFGYQRITVERPLRRRWDVTEEAVAAVEIAKPFLKADIDHDAVLGVLRGLVGTSEATEAGVWKVFWKEASAAGLPTLAAPVRKAILAACAVPDPEAEPQLDSKKQVLPDPDLRDNENVPLTEEIDEYVAREVLPHVPDAWVDESKTRVGYEIPFTRFFYEYVPPRPLAEIDAEIDEVEAEIQRLLGQVAR